MTPEPAPKQPSSSFIVGAIALVFLAIGYQTALLVHRAATLRIASARDQPDTVYVIDPALAAALLGADYPASDGAPASADYPASAGARPAGRLASAPHASSSHTSTGQPIVIRRSGQHPAAVRQVREQQAAARQGSRREPRHVESFRFDPNTVSIEDLIRLGFTPRQAEAIDHYRAKGGRFRRKEDFARSYVVEDSVYARLEPYISIPKIDLNRADSAAFDALPGIGAYYAAKMVAYRRQLGGYSYPEQLMDLYRFDQEKYDGLKDLISVGPSAPYPLWTLPEDSLRLHPYIGPHAAHGIVLFRDNNPREAWTVEALSRAGILRPEDASRLARCRLAEP